MEAAAPAPAEALEPEPEPEAPALPDGYVVGEWGKHHRISDAVPEERGPPFVSHAATPRVGRPPFVSHGGPSWFAIPKTEERAITLRQLRAHQRFDLPMAASMQTLR